MNYAAHKRFARSGVLCIFEQSAVIDRDLHLSGNPLDKRYVVGGPPAEMIGLPDRKRSP